MNKPNWIFISDVDGTLDFKCAGVGEKVIENAKDFVSSGGGLSLATGRAVISTEQLAAKLNVNTLSILYGGSMLYDFRNKSSVWICPLDNKIKICLKELIQNYKDVCIMVYTDNGIYMLNDNHMIYQKGIPLERDNAIKETDIYGNILKVNLCGERESIENIKKTYFNSNKYNFKFSSQHFAEIVSSNAGKGYAMEVLSDITGVPLERFIAMGDAHNDIEMIKKAGVAFAMGNAILPVKEASDKILPNCWEQGAALGFSLAKQLIE